MLQSITSDKYFCLCHPPLSLPITRMGEWHKLNRSWYPSFQTLWHKEAQASEADSPHSFAHWPRLAGILLTLSSYKRLENVDFATELLLVTFSAKCSKLNFTRTYWSYELGMCQHEIQRWGVRARAREGFKYPIRTFQHVSWSLSSLAAWKSIYSCFVYLLG